MEPSSSNFIFQYFEIIAYWSNHKTFLPYLKAGINRLLYPQKYIHKGIVQVGKDSIVLDDDRRDETVLSFCELIFSHYVSLFLIAHLYISIVEHKKDSVIDAINRRDFHVRNKRYASFHEVHMFLSCLHEETRGRILHYFQFSNKTIIELLDLLEEEDRYGFQAMSLDSDTENHLSLEEDDDDDYDDPYEWYIKNHGDPYEWYTEKSHHCFEELIKRENYPPLFFAVLVYNYIRETPPEFDLVDFVFTPEEYFKLDTLSIKDVHVTPKIEFERSLTDLRELIQNNQPYSDCKFTEWVDEWLENFDSFVKKDEFLKWIDYDSDEFGENHNDIILHIRDFLLSRGWKLPGHGPLNDYGYIRLKEHFKKYVGDELKRWALKYSIIQDCIHDDQRAMINWWLSKTHYYTIFNKLVEYYSAAYSDNGQRQIPLQEAESSAAKKSNDDEQQNIPVIVIDKDEAHKEWFVRVHEKKINAQPDEWNKKLYTCLDALYDSLVKKGLMCESSKKELFIYRFSGFNIPESFNPQEKIRWEGKNVLLGYLVRCLITYTGSDAKGLGTVGTFFESKRGKDVNLATADYISKEDFNQTPNMFPVLSLAVDILKECGFEEVEATSTRKRDK